MPKTNRLKAKSNSALTCADGILDGRTLVQRHLIVAAHGTDGAGQRRAEHRAERSGRTFAADGVLRLGTGSGRAPTVLALFASATFHQGNGDLLLLRHVLLAMFMSRVLMLFGCCSCCFLFDDRIELVALVSALRIRRIDGGAGQFLVKVAMALAFRVAAGRASAHHLTIGRTDAAGATMTRR